MTVLKIKEIEWHISPPAVGNTFPTDKVECTYLWWINNGRYQIRIDIRPTDTASFANLYRFADNGNFQPIATRKPGADYGIGSILGKPYDLHVFDEVMEDLEEIARAFESPPE